MGMEECSAANVVEQFLSHRLGAEIDGDQFKDTDKNLFRDLVTGADERLTEIDAEIQSKLDKERTLERLDLVMQACLRIAVYELMARIDTKAVVIITEYVALAKTFFTGKEPAFVNGVLDRIARDLRSSEFTE